MSIHPTLQKRLQLKRLQYDTVTKFAELLPLYADTIIEKEFSGNEYCQLASHYKDMYFPWGINWTVNKPTNFPDTRVLDGPSICVYINCISLFGDLLYYFAQKRLYEDMKYVPAWFVDDLNSTWYFKPEELENGLEALNAWYNSIKAEGASHLKEMKRKQLEAELEKLNE